ncbi:MAG: tRNA (N(6)-L-threonylcarbamoyladenosine(37)-C(2))-methylthiotransferase MtaB [Lachnospiraceae bacterium]|nr:tRNA (N(6)-L-threonylcarbamoyladenosine(37)-C(2))-methylthiotransferase MtaB [Lachnospiraceae bacterium]
MRNRLCGKTFAIHTLGCKVNTCESAAIRLSLLGCGAVERSFDEIADIYIVNTCTVTNIADRKSRQMLHRARTMAPDALIVATGCYVQEQYEEQMREAKVDLLVGNRRKGEIVTLINDVFALLEQGKKGPFVYLAEESQEKVFEDLPAVREQESARAFMKIQDGCNQFCSYCIIPFARGRIASRSEESVLAEARLLAENGVKEIVLNGIHLSSYGLERYSVAEQAGLYVKDGELPLLPLLRSLSEIPGITRIRLGSLEPRALTEETVAALSGIPKLCPQFHLSLQSGCDKTLAVMNRKYTTEEYAAVVERLRRAFDDPGITTDIIVGFPGESEEDFAQSLAFAERIAFSQVHVFPYSRRKHTVADRMEGQLTEAEKKSRVTCLIRAMKVCEKEFRERRIGVSSRVLFEERRDIDGEMCYVGYSREYVPFALRSDEDLTNRELDVTGTGLTSDNVVLSQETVAI